MRFDIHHHSIELGPEVRGHFDALFRKLDHILERLNQMAVDTTKILADITAQTTVLQSLVTFVQAINATNADQAKQIADLKAALAAAQVNDPAVQAAVDAIDATVQSNTALAAGVMPAATANTPSA